MSGSFWASMHGATAHFPIALMIASVIFDLLGFAIKKAPYDWELHAAGFYTLMLAALGSMAAVLTGLLLTSWETLGGGPLGKHHLFVWPGFGLIIGLAVWRALVRDRTSRTVFGVYAIIALIAMALMCGSGYWGGEMLLMGR